jgi:hypothetical protein
MKTKNATHQLDRDPTPDAHAEWLVVSAGAASAAEAVRQARERGMRVDHLALLQEAADDTVRSAATHAKHIIVVESSGSVAEAVQRLLPQIGVVPLAGDAPAELILQRLLFTPRCC